MCEIKTSNQFRQPKQVEATVRWREISEGHLPPPVSAGGARRHEPDPPRLGRRRRGSCCTAASTRPASRRRCTCSTSAAGGGAARRPAGGARPRAAAAGGAHGQRARPPRDGGVRRPRRGGAAPGASRAADALDEAGGRRAAARHAVLEPAARRRRRPAAERARAPRVRRDGRLSAAVWRRGEHARVVWRRSSRDPRALTPPFPRVQVIMRESERDELVEIMEQMGGLSHTAAAAAIAQGATASSLASATLPGLVQREQTNVFQPLRFDSVMPPGKRAIHTETTVLPSRPGSAKRSPPRARPWSHSLGRRPVTAPTSAAASAAPSAQNSRPSSAATRPPSARGRAPPRAKSPSDRRLGRELKRRRPSRRRRRARGPPSTRRGTPRRRRHFLSEEEEGSDAQGGPLGPPPGLRPVGPPRRRGPERHAPVGPLVASGSRPFPRSRHSFVGVPARGLALLSGGRSVKAAVVLRDLYVLDVEATAWTSSSSGRAAVGARVRSIAWALGPR